MEKGDILTFIYLIVGFMLLTVSSYFAEPWRTIIGTASFFVVFLMLFGQDIYAQLASRKYKHMWAIICSFHDYPRDRIQLWFKKAPKSTFVGYKDGKPWYLSVLELSKPIKHPRFGLVKKIKLLHKGQWEDRIKYDYGRVIWADMSVEHSATTTVVLYELTENLFHKPVEMEILEPIPLYELHWTKKDYEWQIGRLVEREEVQAHG
jgi:hypothetical protein